MQGYFPVSSFIIYIMRIILLFILLYSFEIKCQEWIRVFGVTDDAKVRTVIESYDSGYLIGGHYRSNDYLWYYGWLLKTNINGELLWDLKFGNESGSYATFIFDIEQTDDGGIIMCGSNYLFDNKDGFIMKLDACGQKEWCKIFKTWNSNDMAVKIKIIPEGGYIIYYQNWGNDLADKRIWLFKLDEEGNTIWQNLYGTDTSYINEFASGMIITPDSGFLLTGYNMIEIDTMPGYYYKHPFFIKVNKVGEEEWDHTYWPETGFGNGEARYSICDNKGNSYSTGHRGNIDEPILIKLDKNGEPLFHKILLDDIYYGKTSTINFLEDSTLVLGGAHGPANGQGVTKIWKLDTLGNILDERDSLLINVGAPYDATVTFDNKIVFVETDEYYQPGSLDIVMYKLNSDLEWDSVYTQPFEYDYLCPEPIVSDTIPMDCDIITDLAETINKPAPELVIKPNPAKDKVVVELPEYFKTETSKNGIHSTKIRYLKEMEKQLEVYDMMGRLVECVELPKVPTETQLNVSGWEKGLYFLRLVVGGLEVGTGKVVVM